MSRRLPRKQLSRRERTRRLSESRCRQVLWQRAAFSGRESLPVSQLCGQWAQKEEGPFEAED